MKNEEARTGQRALNLGEGAPVGGNVCPPGPGGAAPEVANTAPRFTMPGELIRDRFRVDEQIGQGAFGVVFGGVDTASNNEVAIKCEWIEARRTVLRAEVLALKHLQTCPYVVRYITSGCHQNAVNYVIMERMGLNLVEARRNCGTNGGEISDAITSTRIVMHMLHAIRGIHALGYVHRDIKPSNFVLRKGVLQLDEVSTEECYVIDFGLARRFRQDDGSLIPPRERTGFRGTTRYASINSHLGQELGPMDDLWSLFYVMIELLKGEVPWKRRKEKDEILALKQAHNDELATGLPPQIREFQTHLQTLSYSDTPDYDRIETLLHSVLCDYRQQSLQKETKDARNQYTGNRLAGDANGGHPVMNENDVRMSQRNNASSNVAQICYENEPVHVAALTLGNGLDGRMVHPGPSAPIVSILPVAPTGNAQDAMDTRKRVPSPRSPVVGKQWYTSKQAEIPSPLNALEKAGGGHPHPEVVVPVSESKILLECYGSVLHAQLTNLPSEVFISPFSLADGAITVRKPTRVGDEGPSPALPNDEASPNYSVSGAVQNMSEAASENDGVPGASVKRYHDTVIEEPSIGKKTTSIRETSPARHKNSKTRREKESTKCQCSLM